MWETDWAVRRPHTGSLPRSKVYQSALPAAHVSQMTALLWAEHCVECAVPECYALCPLHVPRGDGRCARFRFGIRPNFNYAGPFGFGAEVSFRRWGKLEAPWRAGSATPRLLALASRIDRFALRPLTSLSRLVKPLSPTMKLNRAYARLRRKLRRKLLGTSGEFPPPPPDFDDFVIEAWNPGGRAIRMVLECRSNRPIFRATFPLHSGRNLIRFPVEEFASAPSDTPPLIAVYPDNDQECEVVFTWLDFVKYSSRANRLPASAGKPAEKVKCVVWDLDNTLWRGVLLEDGPEALTLRDAAVEAIKRLDARGIVHSVASKNDWNQAWKKISETGLDEFFLCPAINWLPKSRSLRQIASDLDIGTDTLAFVDDSAFERGEVRTLLPEVRVYSEDEIPHLACRPEFDVPVTTASRLRRASYLQEARRRSIAVGFRNDYQAFLEHCELESLAFTPCEDSDRQRCLELLHRSNQLNLSTRRYGKSDFLGLLSDAATLSVAWSCKDRFGDYGLVGFLAVEFGEGQPLLVEFVMSCRVARKGVEAALLGWLGAACQSLGYRTLRAHFRPTARNALLREVLREAGFALVEERQNGRLELGLPVGRPPPRSGIVKVRGTGVAFDPAWGAQARSARDASPEETARDP